RRDAHIAALVALQPEPKRAASIVALPSRWAALFIRADSAAGLRCVVGTRRRTAGPGRARGGGATWPVASTTVQFAAARRATAAVRACAAVGHGAERHDVASNLRDTRPGS